MSGRLIVIEGLDGSGKATQTALLSEYYRDKGVENRHITFPDYKSESSALIKMYLAGEIGDVDDVGAYAATSFYAADRYISYKTDWEKDYTAGTLIIADRYSTSNVIYQMSKLPRNEWDEYLGWTSDYEFNKLSLPEPDTVIYLDVEPEVSQELLSARYKGEQAKKDIHEKNLGFLLKCRDTALYAAEKLGWEIVSCTRNGEMLPIEEIFKKIITKL